MTCNLSCAFDSHYHCPHCGTVIKSVSQFETHLKKCEAEKDGIASKRVRLKTAAEYENLSDGRKSSKMSNEIIKPMSEEDRKKHIEHVKALAGENYVRHL